MQKINRVKIGIDFEREAFEYLKGIYDEVEWLSNKSKTIYDFKCIKKGEVLFGDAKYNQNKKKPILRKKQKEADFVITNDKDKINLILKKDFEKGINISKTDYIQININQETKEDFEKQRMIVTGEMLVPISQDEFQKMLLDLWRKRK